MLLEGVPPNAITSTYGLKICSRIINGERGKELHIQIIKKGLLEKDRVIIGFFHRFSRSLQRDSTKECRLVEQSHCILHEI